MKKIIVLFLVSVLFLTNFGITKATEDWEWMEHGVIYYKVTPPVEDCEGHPDLNFCEFIPWYSGILTFIANPPDYQNTYGIFLYYKEDSHYNTRLRIRWHGENNNEYVTSYVNLVNDSHFTYVPFPAQGIWEWKDVLIEKVYTLGEFHLDAIRMWDGPEVLSYSLSPGEYVNVVCFYGELTGATIDNNLGLTCEYMEGGGGTSSPDPVFQLYYGDGGVVYCPTTITWEQTAYNKITASCTLEQLLP